MSREAIAYIRRELAEVRAWTSVSDTQRPRRASGGHVHLTDLAHAGSTGRKHLFIAGLDADSVTGSIVQSSILPDSFRAHFPRVLVTTEERRRLRALQLDAAVMSSGARLALSYATAAGSAGSESGAAHEFLEIWRRASDRPNATYDEMRTALGELRSAVPRPTDAALDARDLWMQLLQDPGDPALLRDAESLVRMHRPHISRGLDAGNIRVSSPTAGEWQGIVPNAALDPRNSGRPVSPSSLEAYAACPMRWFYRYGINAFVPQELGFDEARWLDAASRGSLLHEVYEAIARAGLHAEDPKGTNTQSAVALFHSIAARWRETVPPPSNAVHVAELQLLEDEVRFFLADEHERWTREQWELVEGELRFGERIRASIELTDGTRIAIRGRVDRVDRVRGGLRVIDYKTGLVFPDREDRVPLSGGRRLQLALYAEAVSRSLGEPVVRAEYRFSTAAGGGTEIPLDVETLAKAPELVSGIVGEISRGHFLPTLDRNDCAFCDYAELCRTSPDRFGGTNSPRALWANNNKHLDEFTGLRTWRNKQ
jgi:RecB family exonuclease